MRTPGRVRVSVCKFRLRCTATNRVHGSYVPPCASELWTGPCHRPFTPLAAGTADCTLPPPLAPPPGPAINHSLLRFCFFGFDGLRFDGSSSNRFGGHGGRRGWLFFYFLLTDTRSVGQCFGRFACIAVHLRGLAAYLFALLLFREEALRGLKNLCSLLCLKERETTTEDAAASPKPVNHFQFEFFHQSPISFPHAGLTQKYLNDLLMQGFLPITENIPCDFKKYLKRIGPPPTTFSKFTLL